MEATKVDPGSTELASNDVFRTVCEGAVEGILIAVIESRQIIYANAAACRMFGRTFDEFRTLTVDSIHPGGALDAVLDQFRALLRGDKTIAPAIPCR
jgi:PAS domain S-box-containing protein